MSSVPSGVARIVAFPSPEPSVVQLTQYVSSAGPTLYGPRKSRGFSWATDRLRVLDIAAPWTAAERECSQSAQLRPNRATSPPPPDNRPPFLGRAILVPRTLEWFPGKAGTPFMRRAVLPQILIPAPRFTIAEKIALSILASQGVAAIGRLHEGAAEAHRMGYFRNWISGRRADRVQPLGLLPHLDRRSLKDSARSRSHRPSGSWIEKVPNTPGPFFCCAGTWVPTP